MTDFTTRERLECEVNTFHNGAVIDYGERVIAVYEHCFKGCIAEVYELIETPEETGFDRIECRLQLIAERSGFEDTGHAVKWAMEQA